MKEENLPDYYRKKEESYRKVKNLVLNHTVDQHLNVSHSIIFDLELARNTSDIFQSAHTKTVESLTHASVHCPSARGTLEILAVRGQALHDDNDDDGGM